jgi:undecaprenyl-diphosphatase
VFYYKDLIKIVMAWLKWDVKSVDFKLGLFLIIGTIPIGLIGVLFGDFISSLFGSLLYVGIALIFTGVVLFLTRKIKHGSKKVSLKSGILVGLVQMFAILPGVSRSGMTISSSLILGISREEAARFSFMLAIPAILGATILEGGKIIGSGLGFWPVAVGMISSFVVGYLSLKWLLGVISRDGFWKFGYYVIALGGVLVVVSLI